MNLALDLRLALDPVAFMSAAGLPPDDWQRDFLRSTAMRVLMMCSRQSGKSTVVAALATHTALYQPGALVLVISPSERQSLELFRKIRSFAGLTNAIDPEAETMQRIELANGSRIIALSGNEKTVRGYSAPKLIIVDEAAFTADELWHAASPMLSGGGRVVALTTPNGRQGWFYDAWENGGDAWLRIKITAKDTPRITEEFLAQERASKPHWRVSQEYMCEFIDNDATLFGSDLIEAAITPNVRPILSQPFEW
jgi:hypothetical protein